MAVVLNGPYGQHVLNHGYTVLGRAPDCDIQLDDPRLSRRHARFFWHEGVLKIEDLNSQNGILVNGELVSGNSCVVHGNLIAIGPAVFDVLIDENIPSNIHERSTEYEQKSSTEIENKSISTENMDNNTEGLPLPQTSVHNNSTVNDPSSKIALTQRKTNADTQSDPRLAATISDQKLSKPQELTSQQFNPSSKNPRNLEGALQPNEPDPEATLLNSQVQTQPQETVDAETDKHVDASEIAQLLPSNKEQKPLVRSDSFIFGPIRLIAGLCDGIQNLFICLFISLPILCTGYTVALMQCSASIHQGLPSLDYQNSNTQWQDIALSLSSIEGWERAYALSFEIYEIFPDSFIWIFAAITLAILACTLFLLLSLVAATTIKGAPFWHRQFGLVILERENGFYPTPLRCAIRWLLALCLLPLAALSALFNLRSVHDIFSGCVVKTAHDHC